MSKLKDTDLCEECGGMGGYGDILCPNCHGTGEIASNTSPTNEIQLVLDTLYMQGEQAGEAGYNSATHQITAVNGAEKDIRKFIAISQLQLLDRAEKILKYGGKTFHRDSLAMFIFVERDKISKEKQW